MKEETRQLIKELTELQGISGDEGAVRRYLADKMAPYVDRLEVSPLGNIFGIKKAADQDAPRLMVAAHMDEVGFMVTQIQDNGLMRATAIGGWNVYAVPAQRFSLKTRQGTYPCVSGAVPPHLPRGADAPTIKVSDILFDAGFSSKEEAESYGVRPGDSLIPSVETVPTANGKGFIGKAWDNRYGCAAVIETLARVQGQDLPSTLIAGASVQEEVGLRGIRGAVHHYQPDIFLAVDCSPAGDTEAKAGEAMGRLGDGFLLRVQDPGMITHRGLLEYIQDTADTHQIPYQYFFSKGGTDAGAAHTMNQGIPSGVIGVPARYIHGHQSIFYIEDYEAAKEMLYQVVTSMDQTTINTINQQ